MKGQITKAHIWIFRAVEGAVRNAAHGHPRWRLTQVMACSIAKRAAGTLTANWPDVLAAGSVPSDGHGRVVAPAWPPPPRRNTAKVAGGRLAKRRPPFLRKLWKEISRMAGEARGPGDTARLNVLIEVLRVIAKVEEKDG